MMAPCFRRRIAIACMWAGIAVFSSMGGPTLAQTIGTVTIRGQRQVLRVYPASSHWDCPR